MKFGMWMLLLINSLGYYVNCNNWYMLGPFATGVYSQCVCDINCIQVTPWDNRNGWMGVKHQITHCIQVLISNVPQAYLLIYFGCSNFSIETRSYWPYNWKHYYMFECTVNYLTIFYRGVWMCAEGLGGWNVLLYGGKCEGCMCPWVYGCHIVCECF